VDQPHEALPSRELGLALGLLVGRPLLGMEDLHYGYWPEGLTPSLVNLPTAQQAYTDRLVQRIPDGVRTILDVGCGAGHVAAGLVRRGYEVDCLSPNPTLNRLVRERLGDQVGLFECRYEALRTDRRWDLVLFSECLLFIHLRPGLERARAHTAPGGHVLVTDLFRTTAERGPIGGGHDLAAFRKTVDELAWRVVEDDDVTDRIAPTFDVLHATMQGLRPAYDLLQAQLLARYPLLARLARWLLRRRLARYEEKHLGRVRDGAAFRRHKSYRFVLLRKDEREGRSVGVRGA
jgi:SAM-dependent methyltransferase